MRGRDTTIERITDEGVTLPTWLVAGVIGFATGGVLMPFIMASTEAGSRKLAEISRSYIEKK